MDNNSDDQLLIMQSAIGSKRQYYDEKMKKLIEDLTEIITSIMDQIKISSSSPDKKDLPKAQDSTTVVPDNNRSPPLEGGNSTKTGGMWTLKHDIGSPKFYKLLIKTELKGNTSLYHNKF